MRAALLTAVLCAICVSSVGATVPPTMNFQGILTDPFGEIVPDGNYTVVFAIYPESTGGILLWTEAQTVTTSNGLFNVALGSSIPIPDTALTDTAAYLEIIVETDPPLSPRTRLTSTAYSFESRALHGEGPIHVERYDPSSGAYGSMRMDLEQSAATNDRVKVQFHWESDYPSTGDSSRYDFICTPDSTYEAKQQHKPLQVTKRIDKVTPELSGVVVLCATGSSDTTEWTRDVSAIDGFEESTTTTSASGLATGKRQHKPFRILKDWDVSNSTLSAERSTVLDIDTGFTETARMNKADLISEISHGTSQTREHILLARQVGVSGSASNQSLELQTDEDSNLVRMRTTDDGLGQTAALSLDIVPNQGGTSKNIRKNISVIANASGDSAAAHEVLGLDSGLTRSIAIDYGGNTLNVHQRFGVSPPAPTRMAIAIPNLLDARKSGNESSASTAESREILDADSGYVHTAGMTKADLISHIAREASQTREHILLSRQVGAPGATATRSVDLQTDDDAVSAQFHRGNTTDSSGLRIRADNDSTTLTLYSTTGSTRYSNIVLKRGLSTGAEMRLGYDGAASSAMIYANSNPAAGAQLGINTTSPTAAFHLVGDGCYTGTFGACSDRRYKEHITTLSSPLEVVRQLRGVYFDWKQKDFPDQQFPDGEQIGVIAQEVERVVPSVVHTNDDGYKSVDYAKLVPLLIEGMKSQQQQIEEMRRELDDLRAQVAVGQR